MINKRKFYINGKWIDPSNQNDFEVINPSNEESYAVISLENKTDVDNAVNAAKAAFLGAKLEKKKKFLLEKLLKNTNQNGMI